MFGLDSLLPSVLPMLKKHIGKIEPAIVSYLSEHKPLTGEKGITIMLDMEKDKVFILVVALNTANAPVRVIDRSRVSDFIEKMINKSQ